MSKEEEETLNTEDNDFGNHIVGPGRPGDSPRVMKFPRELTPKEWERHMETHLSFCKSCP